MSRELATVEAIHRRVDTRAAELSKRHAARLKCGRGCSSCCVDALTVFRVEADRICHHASALLAEGLPGPPGSCAFLDEEGACRIYPWRPYVCRTQGLPLRWLEQDEQGDWLEYRDICPLNEEGEPLEALAEADCWTIGEIEGALASLQRATYGDEARVALRDLFVRSRA